MKVLTYSLLAMLCGLLFVPSSAWGQTKQYKQMHMGNRNFSSGRYADAELDYRRVLKAAPGNARATFNLGDTYLGRNNAEEAKKLFKAAAGRESNKVMRGMAYHNLGYIYQKEEKLDSAIACYKEALRNNPSDDNARYNLALCQKLLKDNPKGGSSNQPKPQPKTPPSNSGQEQQQRDRDEDSKNDMSDESVQQLLELSRREEQETRKKINEAQPVRRGLRKNW